MTLSDYKSSFKAYDIRGFRETQIDQTLAYILGLSIGSHFSGKKILIAGDVRVNNDTLIDYLLTGLNKEGCICTVAGLKDSSDHLIQQSCYGYCSSSTAYQLMDGFDLGIVVTASHNPAEYAGFKVVNADLSFIATKVLWDRFEPCYRSLTQPLDIVLDTTHSHIQAHQYQNVTQRMSTYFEGINHNLKIVVDYSGGAAVTFEADFLRSWAKENGHTLIELNTHADGLFSAHSSDTLESENYEQLIKSVLEHGADIGIIYDGDADRLGVVTSSGAIIPGDLVYSLIIQQLHTTGKQIVFDAMSGNSIRRAIQNTSNIPVVCKMGRFFINEKIKQIGALIGGEISGHIMFSQAGGTECVLVATAYLFRSIQESGTLDHQLTLLTQGIYREPMLNLHVEKKDEILAELVHHFQDLNPLTIDGVNIYTPTICLTARKSNTEPIIRIQLEASSKEEFDTTMNQVQDIIKKIEKQKILT